MVCGSDIYVEIQATMSTVNEETKKVNLNSNHLEVVARRPHKYLINLTTLECQ